MLSKNHTNGQKKKKKKIKSRTIVLTLLTQINTLIGVGYSSANVTWTELKSQDTFVINISVFVLARQLFIIQFYTEDVIAVPLKARLHWRFLLRF